MGWSTVINFIEHISMAHQLCHALFTQLELGIKRYTYWAKGQKYFYSPDLLAGPCRTWELCVNGLQGECDWRSAGLSKVQGHITGAENKPGRAGGHWASPHEPWQGQLLLLHWCLSPSKHIFRCWPGTWGLVGNKWILIQKEQSLTCHGVQLTAGLGNLCLWALPSPGWTPAPTETQHLQRKLRLEGKVDFS